MQELKINLGCNQWKLPGFVNVDIDANVNPDVCSDIFDYLDTVGNETVDFIYMGHVLEHFGPGEGQKLLLACYAALRPGGTIQITVPDVVRAEEEYLTGRITYQWYCQVLLGSEETPYQRHKSVFTEIILREFMLKYFTEISEQPNSPYLVSPENWQVCLQGKKEEA